MDWDFEAMVQDLGKVVEAIEVAVIVLGLLGSLSVYVVRSVRDGPDDEHYHLTRRSIGRSILLGLELLVAGDIVRTVAVSPTFTSVGVLAAIVVIRTFLSFTLELEITGRWPWQQRAEAET